MTIKYPPWGAEALNGRRWAILLYGFDIGSAKLKMEHFSVIGQLGAMVRDAASGGRKFAIAVKGNASRSGSNTANFIVSSARATAVSNLLTPMVAGVGWVTPLALGESAAAADGLPDGMESERHRSVSIFLVDYRKKDPPPTPSELIKDLPSWTKPKTYDPGTFSVQMRGGYEASILAGQGMKYKLRFRDLARNQYDDFILSISMIKVELGSPGSIERIARGPEKQFHVPEEMRLIDLPGIVHVDSAAADAGVTVFGYGLVTMHRTLDPGGHEILARFNIPPGEQAWEFGKFGVGAGHGMGYLRVAD